MRDLPGVARGHPFDGASFQRAVEYVECLSNHLSTQMNETYQQWHGDVRLRMFDFSVLLSVLNA